MKKRARPTMKKRASETFHCDVCSFNGKNQLSLQFHRRNKHNTAKEFPCDRCEYEGLTAKSLANHTKSFHPERRLSKENQQTQGFSATADRSLSSRPTPAVLSEPNRKMKKNPVAYHCRECDFYGLHKLAVRNHVKAAHKRKRSEDYSDPCLSGIQEKRLRMCCAHCTFETHDLGLMMQHNQLQHPGI